jgi:hypothetical protein
MIEMAPENPDQVALRKWIIAGLQIEEVRELYGDAGYLLNNMIAKYTLAADFYAISSAALQEFRNQGVDLSSIYPRRTFYGKRGGENPFIYEHAIPAGVVREELLRIHNDPAKISSTLYSSGQVAVLLRGEDQKIREMGLNSKMPSGWKFGENPLARYETVGIQLSTEVLRVSGAICR